MSNRFAVGVKRLLAVCAGIALVGTLSAGPALAQDGSGSGNSSTCTMLVNQFNTLAAGRSTLVNAINASPLNLVLRNQLTALDAQLSGLQDQITAAGCSSIPNLPTTQPTGFNPYTPGAGFDPCLDGGYTNLNYCTQDAYDSGFNNGFNRGAAAAGTPAATQVSSVPTGGVNTGDGSFESD